MTKKEVNGVKDPTKKYYSVGIIQGDELGELSCNENVFNAVERGNGYSFAYTFNTEFKSFQLVGAIPLKK
jgi:hypothetical protein